jgi:hypothetical protein
MAISPWGTFDYVAVVPETRRGRALWEVYLRKPIEPTGDQRFDDRLVGHSPTLEISDAGLAPDGRMSPFTGIVSPKVLRSRMTLTARTKKRATAASVAFHIDRAHTSVLSPGDTLFMARTACAGLALSIVRDGQLVAAAGATSAVPLGELVHVRIPSNVIEEGERVFRKYDPEFEFGHLPVEIRLGDHTRILHGGRLQLQSYEVYVEHGFYRGLPGKSECMSIALIGTCPDVAAIASAQLLDLPDALEMVQWSA